MVGTWWWQRPFGVFLGLFGRYSATRGLDILKWPNAVYFGAFISGIALLWDRLIICRISNPWKGDSGSLASTTFWINGNCFQAHELAGGLYFQNWPKNFTLWLQWTQSFLLFWPLCYSFNLDGKAWCICFWRVFSIAQVYGHRTRT